MVNTPDELFNAPAINPFSDNTLEILGMSALVYIGRQLQAHRRDWKHTRLRIRLPPDQFTPGFEERLSEAVQRYCRAKIEDNALEIHQIRLRSSIGLGILLAVVAAIIAGAYFLFTGPLADVSHTVQLVIAATISLFAWVSLWDPLEALLFNPITLMRENVILRRITQLELVVEPNAEHTTMNGAIEIRADGTGAPATVESQG